MAATQGAAHQPGTRTLAARSRNGDPLSAVKQLVANDGAVDLFLETRVKASLAHLLPRFRPLDRRARLVAHLTQARRGNRPAPSPPHSCTERLSFCFASPVGTIAPSMWFSMRRAVRAGVGAGRCLQQRRRRHRTRCLSVCLTNRGPCPCAAASTGGSGAATTAVRSTFTART